MNMQVFDRATMQPLGALENAKTAGYSLGINSLWTASFSLPAKDPKNALCSMFNYIEIHDGDERIDLFRIIGIDHERSDEVIKTYTCEHVLATLLNDVLFQYHQFGGTGINTADVLDYILGYQTTDNWVLGTCEFARQFEYNWENENLLAALFAVPNCFDSDYLWTWDTTVYPWVLNLVSPGTDIKSEIRYAKNLIGIKKTQDATPTANRIYALGYGEGVNQLTISSINSGVPYVEDAGSIALYGLIPTILVDSRFEVAENLKAFAEQILAQSKEPYTSYEISAIDLHRLTGDTFSQFRPGEFIRVVDTEDNITVTTMIVTVEKGDFLGDPGAVTVTLANKTQDIAGSISDLQNRAKINENYAQGATNVMPQVFADNADLTHPAIFKVYIPPGTVRINTMRLTLDFEPFRSYSTGAASGGGSEKTTSTKSSANETTDSETLDIDTDTALSWSSGSNGHDHGIADNTRLAVVDSSLNIVGSDTFVKSGQHYHSFTLSGHSHDFTIPSHNHTVSIDAHTHNLVFGIYEGTTATSAAVKVDGNTISGLSGYDDINLIPYLSKDDNGKITRGTWHTIEITPNQMSRIVGSLFTQIFVNSRGGGDY